MNLILAVFLTGLTSMAAFAILNRKQRRPFSSLVRSVAALLDWVGLFAVFFATNLAIGGVFILLVRGFTPRFVSLYELQNLLLLIFSAAQAFVFHHWWKQSCT
jgi:hypothetical protein